MEAATDVEGIFRLAGSEKRIKELKLAFNSPDRYGKGLDWTGYTVHDAANILRRYFNQLPEPIIPLDFYERFRQPLRNHQSQAVGAIATQSPSVGVFDHEAAIKAYKRLITELPPLNRQLLLYILDLLAVFASKSDLNKMTTQNLAAIFQPGILNHPQHDMAPEEYRLSQDVLIFLIENQDSFLIGMQGTEADPDTVRDVQSGTPAKQPSTPTTPNRARSVMVGRASSNASVGADSVRKFGNIRRNVSVSSKHSKRSEGGPTPVMTPGIGSPTTPTSGVHRSSTVPSRRTGSAAHSPRFSRDKTSDPPTPSPGAVAVPETTAPRSESASIQNTPIAAARPAFPPVVPPTEVTSPSSSEATTPMAAVGSDTSSAPRGDYMTPKRDTTPLLAPSVASTEQRSPSGTPSVPGGGFLGIFKQSPTSDGEGRKHNKLQKKRIPGSALSSAQSSAQSLHDEGSNDVAQRSPVTPSFPPVAAAEAEGEQGGEHSAYTTAQTTPVQSTPAQALPLATPQRTYTDATLRPTTSPTQSYHSNTDMSDADMVGDDMPHESAEQQQPKKRHRWRFSRSQNKLDQLPQTPTGTGNTGNPLGTMSPREQATSRSTVGSSAGASQGRAERRSIQEAVLPLAGPVGTADAAQAQTAGTMPSQPLQPAATDSAVFSDSERERKGPMSWIRGKLNERKEKEAEKRAKTPERHRERGESKQDLREAMPVRGKSFEQQRLGSSASTAGHQATAGPQAGTAGHASGVSPAVAAQVSAAAAPAQGSPAGRALNGHGHGEGQA